VSRFDLRFHECVIRLEGFGTASDGDYFDGEVRFDLAVDGETREGLVAKVKQAAGSSFADPLEVLPPSGWAGHVAYEPYRDCVERYVREQVAAQSGDHRMIDAEMRVRDVSIPAEWTCSFAAG
jgi:hypothetical protein